jgi:hypothetical protein
MDILLLTLGLICVFIGTDWEFFACSTARFKLIGLALLYFTDAVPVIIGF